MQTLILLWVTFRTNWNDEVSSIIIRRTVNPKSQRVDFFLSVFSITGPNGFKESGEMGKPGYAAPVDLNFAVHHTRIVCFHPSLKCTSRMAISDQIRSS